MKDFLFEGTMSFPGLDSERFSVRVEATRESAGPFEDLWKVVVPADNWQDPILVSSRGAEAIAALADRLGLKHHLDKPLKKLYVDLPEVPPPPPPETEGLLYPSGLRLPLVKNPLDPERYAGTQEAVPLVSFEAGQKVSQHFKAEEFMPRDSSYRYLRLLPNLVELLEAIRAELGGKALNINSGYRPPAYNAEVGGVPRSTHIDGLAADISTDAVSVDQLWEVADRLVGDRGGVGFYPQQQFVHVDLRGQRARWTS